MVMILVSHRRWMTALGAFILAIAPGWFAALAASRWCTVPEQTYRGTHRHRAPLGWHPPRITPESNGDDELRPKSRRALHADVHRRIAHAHRRAAVRATARPGRTAGRAAAMTSP